ncbi:MAG: helix-turn-helix transcriptional regulator [Clostridiales bacterium]|nr:helix-turn-helix transcriptional regulator [Clostridiales bacterium]
MIGETIRNYRKNLNITQAELAEKLSVSQGLIAQFERGSKIPSMILGKELAAALGCGIEELYGKEE